jgi:hypothetical protein
VVLSDSGRADQEIAGRLPKIARAGCAQHELIAQGLHGGLLVDDVRVQGASEAIDVERGEEHHPLVSGEQLVA